MDSMNPEQALSALLEGNRRFCAGESTARTYSSADLDQLAKKQAPIAVVVGCSDSRTSPEIIFDQPLGTIFACRVPGNVAAESSKWVVDMAVSEFQVPLAMVLGHSGCLAVGRVMEGGGWGLAGMLRLELQAGVGSVRRSGHEKEMAEAIEGNAKYAAGQLLQSLGSLRRAVERGETRLVSAVYEMGSGEVRLLG